MKSKKLIEKKPICAGMIKLVLKDYDWLSKEELKEKVDKINKKYTGIETVREDTFTKSITDLLNKKEIALRKTLESENPLEYNPSKDCKKYYFKLTSNFSYKLSPNINSNELLDILKENYTTYLFKLNSSTEISKHNIQNLETEIEAKKILIKKYNEIKLYEREVTFFLMDVYKYNSPNEAYIHYEKFKIFDKMTSYKEIVTQNLSESDLDIIFPFKLYRVNKDNSEYINKKDYHYENGFNKAIFLVYNLVFVIYDFRQGDAKTILPIQKTIDIFNIIQKYILSNK
ncbi:hypothetical protein [Methanoculleus sp.]|uniref:hypothetical protein n=1 Tax=Methanoculleus sp. TaxID=90427 RepID=UPI0025D67CEE|nr:hypothetical protein [Methanoculleus sp.]MCK9320292.1 hypothetical protein [Methanoculleus sp.]